MAARDIEAGRAFVRLYLKDDMVRELRKALDHAAGQLNQFAASATQVGAAFVGLSASILAPTALAVQGFAQYDDAIRTAGAVTRATRDELDLLDATAKRLGATTSFTATEVAGLFVELGRANFRPDEIVDMTGAVLDLARATGTDATTASGILAATLRQFKLEAKDAGRVADELTVAANNSFNTLESIGEAMAYYGPVAGDLGQSVATALENVGMLGNVSIQGSAAGNALRRLSVIGAAEADKLQEIFGVSFTNAEGGARKLVDVFAEIDAATKGLTSSERTAKFNEAFGLLGITGASVLAGSIDSATELRAKLEDAGGAARKTAADMDAGLGGVGRLLLSAVDGISTAFSETLEPVLIDAGRSLTELAAGVQSWIEDNPQTVRAIVATAAAIGALGVALIGTGAAAAGLAFVVSGLSTALAAAGTAAAILFSPAGALLAGLAAAGAGWVAFTDDGRRAREGFAAAADGILNEAADLADGITRALMDGDWDAAWDLLAAAADAAILQAQANIEFALVEWLPRAIGGAVDGAAAAMRPLVDNAAVIGSAIVVAMMQGMADRLPSLFELGAAANAMLVDVLTGKTPGEAVERQLQRIIDDTIESMKRSSGIAGALLDDLAPVGAEAAAAFVEAYDQALADLPALELPPEAEAALQRYLETKRAMAAPGEESGGPVTAASILAGLATEPAGPALSASQREEPPLSSSARDEPTRRLGPVIGDVLTFSAASAAAAGFGAQSPEDKIVEKLDKSTSLLEKLVETGEATAKAVEKQVAATADGYLVFKD